MKIHQIIWDGEWGKAQSGLRRVKKDSGPNISRETFATCFTLVLLYNRRAPGQTDPAGYPATLTARPSTSPEEVTRAPEYKRP